MFLRREESLLKTSSNSSHPASWGLFSLSCCSNLLGHSPLPSSEIVSSWRPSPASSPSWSTWRPATRAARGRRWWRRTRTDRGEPPTSRRRPRTGPPCQEGTDPYIRKSLTIELHFPLKLFIKREKNFESKNIFRAFFIIENDRNAICRKTPTYIV